MSGTAVTLSREIPILRGGFSLVSIEERAEWREALPRQIIAAMLPASGEVSPQWKLEEQVKPMISTMAVLLDRGFTDPQAIKQYFGLEDIGCEYATSK